MSKASRRRRNANSEERRRHRGDASAASWERQPHFWLSLHTHSHAGAPGSAAAGRQSHQCPVPSADSGGGSALGLGRRRRRLRGRRPALCLHPPQRADAEAAHHRAHGDQAGLGSGARRRCRHRRCRHRRQSRALPTPALPSRGPYYTAVTPTYLRELLEAVRTRWGCCHLCVPAAASQPQLLPSSRSAPHPAVRPRRRRPQVCWRGLQHRGAPRAARAAGCGSRPRAVRLHRRLDRARADAGAMGAGVAGKQTSAAPACLASGSIPLHQPHTPCAALQGRDAVQAYLRECRELASVGAALCCRPAAMPARRPPPATLLLASLLAHACTPPSCLAPAAPMPHSCL